MQTIRKTSARPTWLRNLNFLKLQNDDSNLSPSSFQRRFFLVNCIHNKDQKLHLCKFLAEIIEFLARITAQKAYPDT